MFTRIFILAIIFSEFILDSYQNKITERFTLHYRNNSLDKTNTIELCRKCQLTMGYLQSTIINKIESQTTASWIEAMCKLTGSYNITCSALITEYVWNAAEVIHSTNSTSFCRIIHLCN